MKRLLAAAALVLPSLLVAAPPAAAAPSGECANPTDIPILVDYGSLGAPSVVVCAQDGAQMAAVAAITGAGLELEGETEGDESVMCRVNGLPEEKACDSWLLFVGRDGSWEPAPSTVDRQVLAEGDFIALAFGDSATPSPDPDEQLRAEAHLTPTDISPADDPEAELAAEDDGPNPGLIVGAVVVVLAVLVFVAVLFRRRR